MTRTAIFVLLLLGGLILLLPGKAISAPVAAHIDKVVVYKAQRVLHLLYNGQVIRSYPVSLGGNPAGHKQKQGDSRTPEGRYTIDYRNPRSRFYLSLHINYPNAKDRQRAQAKGINPGGDIFIHGLPNGAGKFASHYPGQDWTDGCIAVSNQAIEEIWGLVRNGTPVEINP